jgi:hypothetical protein
VPQSAAEFEGEQRATVTHASPARPKHADRE